MSTSSSCLIGSFKLNATASFSLNGTPRNVPAGPYYLRDAVGVLSLIDRVQVSLMFGAPAIVVYIGQDRRVRMDFGEEVDITIPAALREVLGFTEASYAGVELLVAETVSTLLWSPGWPHTPRGAPVGVQGFKVHDRVMTASPTGGTYDVTLHHATVKNELSWRAVKQSRAWSPGLTTVPGEYADFFERIIVHGWRLKLYTIDEDEGSATAVTWGTGFGPYVVPDPEYQWYQRFVAQSDSLGANIDIAAIVTREYPTS